MAMPCSCSPPSLDLLTEDEIAAAEALLLLHSRGLVGFSLRWLKKRKRSVPAYDEDEELAKGARLSPRTPLSFDPSGGDDTPPPLPPIPPPPPALPLPPRPKRKAPNNNSDDVRCKKLAKKREQIIAELSATKLNLEQSVAEAKSRCQFLKAENAWLKQLHFQWRLAWIHQQQHQRELSSSRAFHLFPVGLSNTVGHHHHQPHTWPMPCLNWKPPAAAMGAAARKQQRAAECAQARKRRLELQRTKTRPSTSLNMQRLR